MVSGMDDAALVLEYRWNVAYILYVLAGSYREKQQ
jgi:hypothetical protein